VLEASSQRSLTRLLEYLTTPFYCELATPQDRVAFLEAAGGNDGGVVIVVIMTSSTEACHECRCAH
jgi:hypothetical protein